MFVFQYSYIYIYVNISQHLHKYYIIYIDEIKCIHSHLYI